MKFVESDLQFRFSHSWSVIQYDATRYFHWFSGEGLKGVDFVGYTQAGQLCLIEVKHFGRYPAAASSSDSLPAAQTLALTFRQKIEDSLQGVRAIQKYMQTKWLYKLCRPLAEYLQRKKIWPNEWGFWTIVARLATDPDQASCCVLLVETGGLLNEPELANYLRALRTELNGKAVQHRWLVGTAAQIAAQVGGLQIVPG